jgi:hypothetical protein
VTCTEIPKILAETKNACEQVARQYPNCLCEAETVCPQYSSGIVVATEQ